MDVRGPKNSWLGEQAMCENSGCHAFDRQFVLLSIPLFFVLVFCVVTILQKQSSKNQSKYVDT